MSRDLPTSPSSRERAPGGVAVEPSRSVALLVQGQNPPAAPEHCLRACLSGDPGRIAALGCEWLNAIGRGESGAAGATHTCRKGFACTAESVQSGGRTGVLVTVGGALPGVMTPLDAVSGLLAQTEQLAEENEGLADEVLRSYEQLNVVFEFTRRVACLTRTSDIEQTFLHRLFDLLRGDLVQLLRHDGTSECVHLSGPSRPIGDVADPRVARNVESIRASSSPIVFELDGRRVAGGVLKRLDGHADVVLIRRPADAGEFTAGDLLLLENVLTLVGQLLGNCELHERVGRMSMEATRALVAAIDKKDHYTRGHSERVGLLSRMTGLQMGLPPDVLHVLEWSGLLHDVGKIGIPEEVLNKPGRLTDEEFAVIRRHPEMGYDILRPISSFTSVLDGVLYHHENPDGTGYPRGLRGDEIPLVARIIHVVDVFDALTSRRSYRDSFATDRAIQILRQESGTKLDAGAAAAFLRALETMRENDPGEFEQRFGQRKEL